MLSDAVHQNLMKMVLTKFFSRVESICTRALATEKPRSTLAAVNGDAVLGVLVLAGLQVAQHLLRELCKEPSVDNVVLQRGVQFGRDECQTWCVTLIS